jgi:predicted dehydrogenase
MELSPGIELIWLLAGREASSVQASEVEPDHFFCGLLKFADMKEDELKAVALLDLASEKLIEEHNKLKWHLHLRSLDSHAGDLRHSVRQALPHGSSKPLVNMPHRSEASRRLLEQASALARRSQETLAPHHLLYVLLDCPTPAIAQALKQAHLPWQGIPACEAAGFTAVSDADSQIPEIGVGMLGYAFMGKAHTDAYKKIPYVMYPPPVLPKLVAICGRDATAAARAARRFGYLGYYTDWHQMMDDSRIQLFDNGGSNDIHAEPCIEAAASGKHVLCEKPLARDSEEAKRMLDAVTKAGVKHQVAFNYRFVPAIRLAYDLIQSGQLGRIYHYRAVYLQEWNLPQSRQRMNWRLDRQTAGSGALGDLGAHIIDLGRFLVGEFKSVGGLTRTFVNERQRPDGSPSHVDVDDAFVATIEFENGALGSVEATRLAAGRENFNRLEINAEKGTLCFNLERLNELEVFWGDEQPRQTQGFHNVLVSDSFHPFWSNWWPQEHMLGWEYSYVHELTHFLDCIANNKSVAPYGATFEDGYRTAVICDAILASATSRRQVDIQY